MGCDCTAGPGPTSVRVIRSCGLSTQTSKTNPTKLDLFRLFFYLFRLGRFVLSLSIENKNYRPCRAAAPASLLSESFSFLDAFIVVLGPSTSFSRRSLSVSSSSLYSTMVKRHFDTISDLFTRLKMGQLARKPVILHPYSNLALQVIKVFSSEGYIRGARVVPHPHFPEAFPPIHIEVYLKYDELGQNGVITKLRRVSKPSKRIHIGIQDLPPSHSGLGRWILATSKGVMSDVKARKLNVGGEVLGEVL